MDIVPNICVESDSDQSTTGDADDGEHGGANTLGTDAIADSPSFMIRKKKKTITFSADTHMPDEAEVIPSVSSANRQVVRKSSSSNGPEWYSDLDDQQVNMFKQVFDLLDADGGGSIDAAELFSVLKEIDSDITIEEIECTLQELDKDGNGEIDFDEFLYCMTETERYLDKIGKERRASQRYSQRQTLFFTAITKFAIKSSIGEVERYYAQKARQAPHVISCYTAGARLIGLTDQQLEQEIRRMRKAAENSTSPYAKPLPFVTLKPRKRKKPAKKQKSPALENTKSKESSDIDKISCVAVETGSSNGPDIENWENKDEAGSGECLDTLQTVSPTNLRLPSDAESSDDEEYEVEFKPVAYLRRERRAAVIVDEDMIKMLKALAESGNVVAKIPDIHLIPGLKQKIDNAEPLCSSIRKKKKLQQENNGKKSADRRKQGQKSAKLQPSWTIPRIERCQTPLPVIPVPKNVKPFTIEDVPLIRKKVYRATNEYYSELKKAYVKTAVLNWDNLHPGMIKSETLTEAFQKVYRAYSPHKEAEVLALCPWIPRPRYTTRGPRALLEKRQQQAQPLPSRPQQQQTAKGRTTFGVYTTSVPLRQAMSARRGSSRSSTPTTSPVPTHPSWRPPGVSDKALCSGR